MLYSPWIKREVTDYKALPLSLVEWQRVYVERLGLSENTPPNESGQVLPFHPKTLELEIERYHVRHWMDERSQLSLILLGIDR